MKKNFYLFVIALSTIFIFISCTLQDEGKISDIGNVEVQLNRSMGSNGSGYWEYTNNPYANDIASNENGATYMAGNDDVYGWDPYRKYWVRMSFYVSGHGIPTRIAVDEGNHPWVVTSTNDIYRHEGGCLMHLKKVPVLAKCMAPRWVKFSGTATDISIANNKIWKTGASKTYYGHHIYYWSKDTNQSDFPTGKWIKVFGEAVNIDVDPGDGNPFVVNKNGLIYKRNSNGTWKSYPGKATDIAAGINGAMWVTGIVEIVPRYGYKICMWKNPTWIKIGGLAVRIAIGKTNTWVLNGEGKIYR